MHSGTGAVDTLALLCPFLVLAKRAIYARLAAQFLREQAGVILGVRVQVQLLTDGGWVARYLRRPLALAAIIAGSTLAQGSLLL